jgi:hypothetical protein
MSDDFVPRRCGQRPDGAIRAGACGKPYPPDYAFAVCDNCSILWDIAHASLPGLRHQFADEYARLNRCSREAAVEEAWKRWPDRKPGAKARARPEKPSPLKGLEGDEDCQPY